MTSRKPWIGGNWKCNGTVESITKLCVDFNNFTFDPSKVDVVICPTMLHLQLTKDKLDTNKFTIAAQNVSKTGNGAFTGEISVPMLKDFGVATTLIGHSERRQLYGETNEIVAQKVATCLLADVVAVICIGETLDERKADKTMDVVKEQLAAVIPKINDWSKVVIAYEPVWAIGTGVVATPEEAQEVHQKIREFLKQKCTEAISGSVRIVYGGSVNDENCCNLISCADIDGFLVGGASLKPSFGKIIDCAK